MSHPTAEHRLTHVLRHLDAVCSLPATARPGYDELAPIRLPAPSAAAEAFFRATAPLPPNDTDVQWLHFGQERLPVLFDGDLVSSIFYWLSGWQEVYSTTRDRYGRFPYAASLQARLNCVELPVADMLLETFRIWLEDASSLSIPRFEALPLLEVSHDVDHLYGGWRGAVRKHWRFKQPLKAAQALIKHFAGLRDPFDNLTRIAQIVQEETGLHPTFYFLGAQGKHLLGSNADYDLSAASIQDQIRCLERLGCSIGLHGSFGSSDDAEQLRRELEKLPHLSAGVRFHFLRFDPVQTPEIISRAGATYDATLGFAERAGFRHGTAHPFWLFDFTRLQAHRVVCHPLHAMDVTFKNPAYQPTPAAAIPFSIANLARAAHLCGGTLSLLWHNEYVVKGENVLGEETLRQVLRQAVNVTNNQTKILH